MGELQRCEHQKRRGDTTQLGATPQHGRLVAATGCQRHSQTNRVDQSVNKKQKQKKNFIN